MTYWPWNRFCNSRHIACNCASSRFVNEGNANKSRFVSTDSSNCPNASSQFAVAALAREDVNRTSPIPKAKTIVTTLNVIRNESPPLYRPITVALSTPATRHHELHEADTKNAKWGGMPDCC